jgi:hypothetical protein
MVLMAVVISLKTDLHWKKKCIFPRISVSIWVGIKYIFRPVLRVGLWAGISPIFGDIPGSNTVMNIADIPGVFTPGNTPRIQAVGYILPPH